MAVAQVAVPRLVILTDADVFVDQIGKDQRNQNDGVEIDVVPGAVVYDPFLPGDQKEGKKRNTQYNKENKQLVEIVLGLVDIFLVFFILIRLKEQPEKLLEEGILLRFFVFIPGFLEIIKEIVFDRFLLFRRNTPEKTAIIKTTNNGTTKLTAKILKFILLPLVFPLIG